MPNGHVHAKYHKRFMPAAFGIAACAFTLGLMVNSYIAEGAVWFMAWYWCGRYVDPDWDLLGITQAEGRILRELGPFAPFLIAMTAFYSASMHYIIKLFKIKGSIGGSHRTWITHSLIPGTVSRQAIICLGLLYVVNLADFFTRTLANTMISFHPYDVGAFLVGQFLGLAMSDLIHILLDKFYGGE